MTEDPKFTLWLSIRSSICVRSRPLELILKSLLQSPVIRRLVSAFTSLWLDHLFIPDRCQRFKISAFNLVGFPLCAIPLEFNTRREFV